MDLQLGYLVFFSFYLITLKKLSMKMLHSGHAKNDATSAATTYVINLFHKACQHVNSSPFCLLLVSKFSDDILKSQPHILLFTLKVPLTHSLRTRTNTNAKASSKSLFHERIKKYKIKPVPMKIETRNIHGMKIASQPTV
ncbi:hypothetical protein FC38_GL001792 [Lactobacillus gigeriorum DSM 23908 = CRBIP 24.85]|uniref:Uncharacterized protein n=1 Tax=Lactobacillus gigeriorum DSM 23908 = CRBIP 24.85 TaxID=1423751 RepID=A0ABR5PYC5_9LACO|nr:hypothetical protein FC38_GL001792 [Lactobacillus gigeriorum DSM 23908 = CRBIP 24.85]